MNLDEPGRQRGWGYSSDVRASDCHAAEAGSAFSADSLTVSVHSRVQLHALTFVSALKIMQSMSEFVGLWKYKNTQLAPQVRQHDSVAAGFPRGKQPEFPWENSQWDDRVGENWLIDS